MNIQAVISLLGVSADDQRIRDLLKDAGSVSGPKLKRGDTDAYVEIPTAGLYFVFTDEAFFRKTPGAKIGTGPLLLTNVTVYCTPTDKYAPYAGTLPFGLECSDSRDAARAKLGMPQVAIDRRRLDRWTIDDIWVYAVYARDLQSTERAGVQLPDA
jgi:hypothetical protein